MTETIATLKRWGSAQMCRYDRPERPADHVLERNRRFAPMTRQKAAQRIAARDGIGRRRMMGEAAERFYDAAKANPIPVPMWACDPIPCKDSAPNRGGHDAPITPTSSAWVDPVPECLHWIDRALSQLARINLVRMMVLREEFTGNGTQLEKSKRVAEEYGGALTVWQYRRELQKALAFVEAKFPG